LPLLQTSVRAVKMLPLHVLPVPLVWAPVTFTFNKQKKITSEFTFGRLII
jgi:hypothetical protein